MPEIPDRVRWYALNVNPEPWAVGPLSVIRRGGKLAPTMGRNQQLDAYKHAVRETIETKYPHSWSNILEPKYVLDFFFWRNTERANVADGTNLMKATEDALQGILIDNDRNVVQGRWTVAAQGPDVAPAVAFRIGWAVRDTAFDPLATIPIEIAEEIGTFGYGALNPSNNDWPPRS